MSIDYKPQQSFQHTLKEIAVNRQDPCELVRELVSNAYDAKATEIIVMPYLQKKGLIFFDNGVGLSESETDKKNGIVPYVAFFSIGRTTKIKGSGIGYKCQGSKLCFASSRVTVITRCAGEDYWRIKLIDNPKQVLNENYDLKPDRTTEPWTVLADKIIVEPDERSVALLENLSKDFFEKNFKSGTLLVIDGFDVQDYGKYFSVGSADSSYLYNYLRFVSAHGDVRHIPAAESGFTSVDTASVTSNRKSKPVNLRILTDPTAGAWKLEVVPHGYPYLPVKPEDEKLVSPSNVNRLRDGRFCARYATVFDHEGQKFSVIIAVDGKRRTLDGYKQLGRQRQAGCGIPLSSQRGVFLTSHGVRVCPYEEVFREDALADFDVLADNTEHHLIFIDGPFELVTNRNSPAPESLRLLKEAAFLEKVKAFLNEVKTKRPRGTVLRELVERLSQERTHEREDQYHKIMAKVKESLPGRSQFQATDAEGVKEKWFLEPAIGEENMVGAFFTLFAHLVPVTSPAIGFWNRPLTFSAYGIDAVSSTDEKNLKDSLQYLEYKHTFSSDVEFNHPFSITNEIVCWDYANPVIGTNIEDSYNYVAQIKEILKVAETPVGFTLGDIRLKSGMNAIGNVIRVLSLRRLLETTFKIKHRAATTTKAEEPNTNVV
jgi:hypothetical protein